MLNTSCHAFCVLMCVLPWKTASLSARVHLMLHRDSWVLHVVFFVGWFFSGSVWSGLTYRFLINQTFRWWKVQLDPRYALLLFLAVRLSSYLFKWASLFVYFFCCSPHTVVSWLFCYHSFAQSVTSVRGNLLFLFHLKGACASLAHACVNVCAQIFMCLCSRHWVRS